MRFHRSTGSLWELSVDSAVSVVPLFVLQRLLCRDSGGMSSVDTQEFFTILRGVTIVRGGV